MYSNTYACDDIIIIVVRVHRRIINHIACYSQMDQNKCKDSTKVLYLLVLA